MSETQFTSFLIGFSSMFVAHYLLEPTWGLKEPRPNSIRMIFNYTIGTLGICLSFLYMHPEFWKDMAVSVGGAALATIVAHGRDWIFKLWKRDQADGLINDSQTTT